MAQISSYPYDAVVQDQDAWIGTDSTTRATKQFTASAVATYLNIKGKISIGAQMPYQFKNAVDQGFGSFSLPTGGSGIPFSSITSLRISVNDLSLENTIKFFEYLVGSDLMIGQMGAVSIFGHFKVSTYLVDPGDAQFYNLALNHIGSNGSLVNDNYYDIFNFTLASASDKTQVFNITIPATVWDLNHSLSKYPSITTVTGVNDNQVYGVAEYVSTSRVKITFSTAITGKAFLN